MLSYKWMPLEDLPSPYSQFSSSELENLASIWKDQSDQLKATNSVSEFNEKLAREWAIETGVLENLYTIDRGITELLINKGIESSFIPHGTTDKPTELVVALIRDQKKALDAIFDFVKKQRTLSTSYIKELHQVFTRHQDTIQVQDSNTNRLMEVKLLRGDWKKLTNYPKRPDGTIHQYCPPEHVASEMDRLIDLHQIHMQSKITPEAEAAFLHHRFTQIHPFQDGNGRVARALASLVFIRDHWFPLVIRRDYRDKYLSALEAADNGDIHPLVELFSKIQRDTFLKALSISQDVIANQEAIHNIIVAVSEHFKAQKEKLTRNLESVYTIGRTLIDDVAFPALKNLGKQLNDTFKKNSVPFLAIVDKSEAKTTRWFKSQIIQIARKLEYYAKIGDHEYWARLQIKEKRTETVHIVITIHPVGVKFYGVMAATAFIEYRGNIEKRDVTIHGPHQVCNDIFQFSYKDEIEKVLDSFKKWLNQSLPIAVDQWRKHL